jgi:hypothetical protein
MYLGSIGELRARSLGSCRARRRTLRANYPNCPRAFRKHYVQILGGMAASAREGGGGGRETSGRERAEASTDMHSMPSKQHPGVCIRPASRWDGLGRASRRKLSTLRCRRRRAAVRSTEQRRRDAPIAAGDRLQRPVTSEVHEGPPRFAVQRPRLASVQGLGRGSAAGQAGQRGPAGDAYRTRVGEQLESHWRAIGGTWGGPWTRAGTDWPRRRATSLAEIHCATQRNTPPTRADLGTLRDTSAGARAICILRSAASTSSR